MSTLPALTGGALFSLLAKIGFAPQRQNGSHVFLKHPDGRTTVVPIHSGETIGRQNKSTLKPTSRSLPRVQKEGLTCVANDRQKDSGSSGFRLTPRQD